VERAQRDRGLLVVGGASALPGLGAGGRVPRVLAAGSAGLRPGRRDRLGLALGRRCDDQGAAGRPEDRPESHRQSKKGAKRSVLSEGKGVPIGLDHEGAQRNDHKLLKGTLESIPIERPAPTKKQPQGICLDGAYNNAGSLELVCEYELTPHIRTRRQEIELKTSTPGWRARRWVVEACHSWLNRNRAILIRWSKKDENHLALLQLASGLIAFKKAHAARLAHAQAG
jgi:putative transposase